MEHGCGEGIRSGILEGLCGERRTETGIRRLSCAVKTGIIGSHASR